MGVLDSFTALAAAVWRKYVTDGVPASGLHQPDLDEVRLWGTDIETALNRIATPASRVVVHTASGDVTFNSGEETAIVKKISGAATNVNVPSAAGRAQLLDVIIKDGKGDADTHNITPVFNGGDACDGLTGASLKITTPYGMLWLRPYPDGSGYFQMPGQL
jgi:hypothetical protein